MNNRKFDLKTSPKTGSRPNNHIQTPTKKNEKCLPGTGPPPPRHIPSPSNTVPGRSAAPAAAAAPPQAPKRRRWGPQRDGSGPRWPGPALGAAGPSSRPEGVHSTKVTPRIRRALNEPRKKMFIRVFMSFNEHPSLGWPKFGFHHNFKVDTWMFEKHARSYIMLMFGGIDSRDVRWFSPATVVLAIRNILNIGRGTPVAIVGQSPDTGGR